MQERLALPAFAAAVADVLRCCADALPTLKGITRQEASLFIYGCIHCSLALAILLLTSLAAATLLLSPPWRRCIFWGKEYLLLESGPSIFCLDTVNCSRWRGSWKRLAGGCASWSTASHASSDAQTAPTPAAPRRCVQKTKLPFLAVLPGFFLLGQLEAR